MTSAGMPASAVPELTKIIAGVVTTLMTEIRPDLVQAAVSGRHGESANTRHADNFLSVHDLRMHERYRELLRERIGSFVYASEEADPVVIGSDPDPDLCILVDPLDTSEMAVRALYGYTHVLAYSRALNRPVAAVVGDIFHHIRLYVAARGADDLDRAHLVTSEGEYINMNVANRRTEPLSRSLITNYLMKPAERFTPLARQRQLLDALSESGDDGKSHGRIGVDFGSVGLCHVAAGFTDAMAEFAKGFAVWDLAPGHYILHAAGGVALDLEGQPLPMDYRFGTLDGISAAMNRRQKFVAAGDSRLAQDLAAILAGSSPV